MKVSITTVHEHNVKILSNLPGRNFLGTKLTIKLEDSSLFLTIAIYFNAKNFNAYWNPDCAGRISSVTRKKITHPKFNTESKDTGL